MSSAHGDARALSGLHVLVTRPAYQGWALCRKVEEAGGTAFAMPLLEIHPPENPAHAAAVLGGAGNFDWAIFTSANAVSHASILAPAHTQWPERMAAMGKASAKALADYGLADTVLLPARGNTSEDLLAEPALASIEGSRILLVKGEGGRRHLTETLSARGARVQEVAVYRRRPAVIAPRRLHEMLRACEVAVITSAGALEHFVASARAPGTRALLWEMQLVVPSDRVLQKALGWGFRRTPWVPARVSDDGIKEILVEHLKAP